MRKNFRKLIEKEMKICKFLSFTSRVTKRPPDFRLEIFGSSLPELKDEASLLDRSEETGEGIVRNRMLIRSDAGSVEAYVYYVDGVARSWCMMNGTGFFKGFYAAGVHWKIRIERYTTKENTNKLDRKFDGDERCFHSVR